MVLKGKKGRGTKAKTEVKVRENAVREMKGKSREREEGSRQTPVLLFLAHPVFLSPSL